MPFMCYVVSIKEREGFVNESWADLRVVDEVQ